VFWQLDLEAENSDAFNGLMSCSATMCRLSHGPFEVRLKLPKCGNLYRLAVDGLWFHDLFNPAIETNEYGELNSVVEIKQ